MKRENNPLILCLFGILPVVWLGLLIAPAAHGGLPEIVARFPAVMNDPFHIELCEDSLKTALVLLCAYGLAVGVILSSRRNYRRGEEHGSAKWGSARTVNRKYRAAVPEDNKIFTQNVRMGLDGRKHRRNLNTVVVGGSGAGKTRFYAKPNLCQANTSFTVLDPKGELLRSTGHLLRQKGYEVRVLDLLNMEKSHCYNPFVYLRDDNDVQRLVTNLFKKHHTERQSVQRSLLGHRRIYAPAGADLLSEIRSTARRTELTDGHGDAACSGCTGGLRRIHLAAGRTV